MKKPDLHGGTLPSESDGQIYLIIHADDIGMCHSVNQDSIKAFEMRIVSSGSIMVPCPWFAEAAAYFREHPEFDIGVHITLTSEWKLYRWPPVSSKEKVPGLVDPEGFLWRSSRDVAENASAEEVEMEMRAQIERAVKFGVEFTHIDTHMGTVFFRREFSEAYVRLAEEYGVPALVRRDMSDLAQRVLKVSSQVPRFVHGIGKGTHEERMAWCQQVLKRLEPGLNEIILHLSGDDEEIKAVIGPDAFHRRSDFLIFSDPETWQIIREREMKIIGWRDLHKR